eukprot:m.192740 g.192740  ORF g.192740 m.192740 type:complete len:332 (+) comp15172_c0_seq4:117-1112(+)
MNSLRARTRRREVKEGYCASDAKNRSLVPRKPVDQGGTTSRDTCTSKRSYCVIRTQPNCDSDIVAGRHCVSQKLKRPCQRCWRWIDLESATPKTGGCRRNSERVDGRIPPPRRSTGHVQNIVEYVFNHKHPPDPVSCCDRRHHAQRTVFAADAAVVTVWSNPLKLLALFGSPIRPARQVVECVSCERRVERRYPITSQRAPTISQDWHVVQDIAKSSHPKQRSAMLLSITHDRKLILGREHSSKKCLGEDSEICVVGYLVGATVGQRCSHGVEARSTFAAVRRCAPGKQCCYSIHPTLRAHKWVQKVKGARASRGWLNIADDREGRRAVNV